MDFLDDLRECFDQGLIRAEPLRSFFDLRFLKGLNNHFLLLEDVEVLVTDVEGAKSSNSGTAWDGADAGADLMLDGRIMLIRSSSSIFISSNTFLPYLRAQGDEIWNSVPI